MSDIPLPAWASDPAPTTSDIPIPDWAGGPKGKPKSAAAPSQAIGAPGAEVVDDKALAQEAGKDLLSIADLGASLPAAAIGVAGDVNTRLGAGLAGESHKTISRAGNLAFEEAMQRYGSPFHKLLQAAGLGKVDDGPEGAVDSLMAKATSLLGQGGDAIEKATGGAVNADDVNSMVNFLMTLGGGKGLEAGIRKFAARAPDSVLGGAKAGPEAEKAQAQRAARDSDDPTAGTKFAEGQAAAATKAKTRMTEGKELVFDPATGELGEAVPLPGKEIPKPTTRDRALEKVAGGRSWDMTAEERIAYNAFNREGAPKPIVDAQGNVIDKAAFAGTKAGRAMRGQSGSIDPAMTARLAAIGLGAWAGVHFSDSKDLKAALLGGLAGTMIPLINPIEVGRFAREALGKQAPRFSIADPARSWDSYRRLWQIDTVLLQDKLDAILPDEADRTAVLHAREAGPAAVAALSPKQQEYAKLLGEAFDERLWTGIDNEVLESARDNYITHMWDWGKNDKGLLERFLSSHGIGMSPSTPYAKERTIPTYAEGKALGLTPISEDPTYILGAYSNSLINAISTKNLIDALKGHEIPTSSGAKLQLAMPADKAPREYVSINHQALRGFKVHPDIEGQMKLLFDTAPAGDWMKVATMISDTAKHMGVSLSLFHAKSLVEAAVRASNHPLRLIGSLPSIITGEHEFLREIQKGSASPLVEDAVNDGVMFAVKGVGSEDGGGAFYSVMKAAADFADSKIPHAGLPFKGFAAINRKLDRLLWERLHPALKLIIYSEKRAALLENSIREGKRTGKPSLSKAEAGRIAASFTNDLEGSLNYPRIAMEAQTQFGRLAAEKAFTPAGRRGLQVAFFAPDWNIAAIRMVANAFRPEGSVRGVLSPRTLADLHRNLILRSALFYFIAFDAINHALSGHHIWQNKDWTKVDMDAKGQRHLQIDKGMMEVPNMIRQPRQEALNKLGFIPSESLNQLMDTEYLSPRTDPRTGQAMAGPPMKGGRVAHAAGRLLPFASHQSPTTGPIEEALTRSGIIQITGSTAETRGEEKRAREAAKRQRELDARRSRHP